jgi:hypothetical protein
LLLFAAFVPALAIMILLNNVAEEIGWTGFVFARFQHRHGPLRAALLTTVFFWLFHVPSFYVETRSWATTALALGIFLLPHLGSRVITGWLYNSAGSSVLIAGSFPSMHNAIVNTTGLVAVVALPQFEVLVIMAGIVVLAAAIIVVATPRPSGTRATRISRFDSRRLTPRALLVSPPRDNGFERHRLTMYLCRNSFGPCRGAPNLRRQICVVQECLPAFWPGRSSWSRSD